MRRLLFIGCLAASYLFGAFSAYLGWPPAPQFAIAIYKLTDLFDGPPGSQHSLAGRTQVDCSDFQGDAMVLLTIGQSNAANAGAVRYSAGAGVANLNPFNQRCYAAQDPLLGATGIRGSVWGRLGDKVIAAGLASKVLVLPLAVGGSKIARWAPGGDLNSRIELARQALDATGLEATHVLWHQGESDAPQAAAADYMAAFRGLTRSIRHAGIEAPIFVAQATLCDGVESEDIRAAQRKLPELLSGVFPGPNTDTLDRFRDRKDFCHFSESGLDQHAELWLTVLRDSP